MGVDRGAKMPMKILTESTLPSQTGSEKTSQKGEANFKTMPSIASEIVHLKNSSDKSFHFCQHPLQKTIYFWQKQYVEEVKTEFE